MEQDQMGCNQIGLHFELHPLQCGTSVFVLFCVADYRRYNLYFIVCSNLAMSERLLSGIFTKEQSKLSVLTARP
jgi:hypothetical protein